MKQNRPPKTMVWVTLALMSFMIIVTSLYARSSLPEGITIDTTGQPTIGLPQARVQLVLFEEPKCVACRDYSKEILPKIKKNYIDTNKIRYTTVLVSFLPNSMNAAEALLCVYNQEPEFPNAELFYAYLDYIYRHQPDEKTDWAKPDLLANFAKKTSPAIDLSKLKDCVNLDTYRIQIEKNSTYAALLMGGQISTPTLFVNGVEVKELTYEKVSELIDEFLKKEGVY
jgi:protein-disulfide isomerase